MGWSVELSEYHLRCEARGLIKAQCLMDFVNKLIGDPDISKEVGSYRWTVPPTRKAGVLVLCCKGRMTRYSNRPCILA